MANIKKIIRAELSQILAEARPAPFMTRVNVIRQTVEALGIDDIFRKWMKNRFGKTALVDLSEYELELAFAYCRTVAKLDAAERRIVELRGAS